MKEIPQYPDPRFYGLYRDFYKAALELLADYGWVPFGYHAVGTEKIEFSTQVGQDGLPYFERVAK